ncbi:Helicase associated domain (HA2) [Carpediemonas membranifera]|uniref:Helicase associated domain (HA2) n=1 Tax=Carpediemonas membranifera TaxID=201153 RepID=A0A8J6E2N0_9EUKA|nr:Helicase associated domain (HA2) [Carpediemonas membranifera]|eukprot:KAG9394526.1 Helicase associated domain (HA2) [Carpediemonas membranifera]
MVSPQKALPVYASKKEILKAISSNTVTIVVGATGSGKTTQIPQYLLELSEKDKILCTQPRRVAAISIAHRVAEERNCEIGSLVGYSVRFDDKTSSETRLKYATDGMVIRELANDHILSRYKYLLIDEAHERTVATDVLLGVARQLAEQRTDSIRIIIMSATLDVDVFSAFFASAAPAEIDIPGRTFEVAHYYVNRPEPDYTEAAFAAVVQVHENEPRGDILVFMTGQEDIVGLATQLRELAKEVRLKSKDGDDLWVVPLFSALPYDQQRLVFKPTPKGMRKVVIATNIAEASITIPNLTYVIDSGLVKQRRFDPHTLFDTLSTVPISKASVRQRSGRAGRVGPGKVFHLYTRGGFLGLEDHTDPEIVRCDLAGQYLQLLAAGRNVLAFPFISPPPTDTKRTALRLLLKLGAIQHDSTVDPADATAMPFVLTDVGTKLAKFPLEPNHAMSLIAAHELGCLAGVLTVMSMLSVDNILAPPHAAATDGDDDRVRSARAAYASPYGDHLTMMRLYNAWEGEKQPNHWCKGVQLNPANLKKAKLIRTQLEDVAKKNLVDSTAGLTQHSGLSEDARVLMALCRGMVDNIADRNGPAFEVRGTKQQVFIHPTSVLFRRNDVGEHLLFDEQVVTTKKYIRVVSKINAEWLVVDKRQ